MLSKVDILDVIAFQTMKNSWRNCCFHLVFRQLMAFSIRPNVPEIPGRGANGKDISFPEFNSEVLDVSREAGLKFRKIGITGKFRAIRPFLLGSSFSEPGNRTQHGWCSSFTISVISARHFLSLTDDWNLLLQHYCSKLATTRFSK